MQFGDLEHRVYCGKECVQFDYTIRGDTEAENQMITFHRMFENNELTNSWTVRLIISRTAYLDTQVYSVTITMPKSNIPLVVVCEAGLRALKALLAEEVQRKSALVFTIGGIIDSANEQQVGWCEYNNEAFR